ncbi:MAG TPA: ribonuclease R [Burkholderiales bacterium]|nr:ribonuclease R [Burkholderiales bacterium]
MKKRSIRNSDPWLARERDRYEHPLPSREFILQLLAEQGVPVPAEELERLLDITGAEREPFARRLEAMERAGQIMRNRKGALCVVEKLDLVRGRVEGHPDGFGFLIPEAGGADIFLSPKQMNKVLHGDRAMVRITGTDRRGRPEGKIVEVLERGPGQVVGRLYVEHGIAFVVAENRRINQDILVPADQTGGARPGQVVTVEIIEHPSETAQAIGRVTEVLGNYADPGMEIEIALRKHDLPREFSRDAEALADRYPQQVQKRDMAGREDLRELPLVTIDGETARDFDDAVHCRPEGRGFRLWVAIADVSHYVRPGDALDRDALERGNSVYFPRRVIPMLPEALSNGLCSINPEVERLCMVCEMAIGPKGDLGEYRFYPAVMRSAARLTYNEVWAILEHPRGAEAQRRKALVPHLQALYRLYQVLVKARAKRGAIDFETIETEMVFDAHGKIERILPVKRNDAHRLIEECMLAANVCASDFLRAHEQPTLYRIHEGPTPEKLSALREFLAEFGLHLSGADDPHARDYAALLEKVRDRPDAQLIQTVMLRSLQQAVYSPENVGHFGLAYESYTHFTSPIRRYPDLLVHRAIKAVLSGGKYSPGDWKQLGAHCSMTERRADEATRDVQTWLKCYFMQDRVGEAFAGTVSGVAPFGLFVALDDVYVEGLVHVSELGADYYHHDAARHMLVGERSRRSFRLGDRLRVRVVRVDMEAAKIDFVPDEAQAGVASGRGRAQPRRARRDDR